MIAEAGREPGAGEAFESLPEAVAREAPGGPPPSRGAAGWWSGPGARAGRALVALEDGRPVARVAGAVSPALRDPAGRPLGVLGSFEAFERPEAVRALLAEAVRSLRGAGAGAIAGPMDGDTWHRYRVNAGPFDEPPFAMEPWNPPFAPALWEGAGFSPVARYASKRLDDLPGAIEALGEKSERALAAGFRIRPIEMNRFPREVGLLYDLSRRIFAGNLLYSEISPEAFGALYEGVRPMVDPDFVTIALAPGGEPAGFLFGFPGPAGSGVANLKTLGVLPGHRRSGIGTALMRGAYLAARRRGFSRANLCLFEAGNPSRNLDGGLGRAFRSYVLYGAGWGAGA